MNQILDINDKLMHLPAGVIVMLFAIVIGYVLKLAQFFPNNRIPLTVICFCSIMFPLVQLCADGAEGKPVVFWNVPLNFMLGAIIGGFAWLFHAQILKRFLDPKIFNDDGSTKFFRNPNPPGNPPAQP